MSFHLFPRPTLRVLPVQLFDANEMTDLGQHAADVGPVLLDHAVADPMQPEPADRVLLVLRPVDHAADLGHPKPGHRRPPSGPRSARPASGPPPPRPLPASASAPPDGPRVRGAGPRRAACGARAARRPPPSR